MISLDATAFRSRKDQRQAINRFKHYVLGHEYLQKAARLCPKTREEKRYQKDHFRLSETILEMQYSNVQKPTDPRLKADIQPAHEFHVILESDNFTEEKWVSSPFIGRIWLNSISRFALFENYQRVVHREDPSEISRKGFKRFLCSGFGQTEVNANGRRKKLGSYHQCYRLDGKLVAIGVLDLLPDGVSSVYLL